MILSMTSTGLGRHNSKPILEWDDVEMEGESAQDTSAAAELAQSLALHLEGGPSAELRERPASPWTTMRKIFKR